MLSEDFEGGFLSRRLANEPFSGRERAAFDRRHQRFRGAVAQGAISVRITVKEGSDILASDDDRLTSTYQAALGIKQVEIACPGCVGPALVTPHLTLTLWLPPQGPTGAGSRLPDFP